MKTNLSILFAIVISLMQACSQHKKPELQKKWIVKDSEFKIPGWHTDPRGAEYDFKSDVVTITNVAIVVKYKYESNADSVKLWNAMGEFVAYKITELNENKLILENNFVNLLLIKQD